MDIYIDCENGIKIGDTWVPKDEKNIDYQNVLNGIKNGDIILTQSEVSPMTNEIAKGAASKTRLKNFDKDLATDTDVKAAITAIIDLLIP